MADSLQYPPFPPLKLEHGSWCGQCVLKSWAGMQSRRGAYGSVDSKSASDGRARLRVCSADATPAPPTAEQSRAFEWLLNKEALVAAAIKQAIYEFYIEIKPEYLEWCDDLPEIEGPHELRSLIGLSNVHVLETAYRDVAYIGFEFGCVWDDEHGLGVVTHLDRVIKTGGADTSFDEWVAKEDRQKQTVRRRKTQ